MATVGAAQLDVHLLCTELAAAESAAAQLFERSSAATQRVLSSMVEVDVAESMLAEALQIGEEQVAGAAAASHAAEERARAAEERGRAAEERARAAEERANAAEERARSAELFAARAEAELQRARRGGRGDRGSRGGRGGAGAAHNSTAPAPADASNTSAPEPPAPPPPPSPPLPDLIARILAVETQREGDMSEAEALEILNVTDRRPKWLLSQVHPDRHPCFRDEATAAAKRVNQAMDVRTRHVTEVSYDSD